MILKNTIKNASLLLKNSFIKSHLLDAEIIISNNLENFEKYLTKFKKVMPIEYRKVLLENIQIKDAEKKEKEFIGK